CGFARGAANDACRETAAGHKGGGRFGVQFRGRPLPPAEVRGRDVRGGRAGPRAAPGRLERRGGELSGRSRRSRADPGELREGGAGALWRVGRRGIEDIYWE